MLVWQIGVASINKMYAGIHVQCSMHIETTDCSYALANYGHSCTALWDSFLEFCLFFYKCLHEKNISCNLNLEFCRLHGEFHSGSKGLNL